MNKRHLKRIVAISKQVNKCLVERDFQTLSKFATVAGDKPESILYWIEESKRTLCHPPQEAFEDLEYTEDDYTEEPDYPEFPDGWGRHFLRISRCHDEDCYMVDFEMWTAEDGRSDYTLEMTIEFDKSGKISEVCLNGLHML